MASEVKTNKLSPSTGVTVTLGDASDVFQLPASAEIDIASGATLDVNGTIDVTGATVTGLTTGIVLQVLQHTLNTSINTTSTSYVASGLTVTITSASTSSRFLLTLAGGRVDTVGGNGYSTDTTFYVDTGGGAAEVADTGPYETNKVSNALSPTSETPHSACCLHLPSTAGAITYTAYYKASAGTSHFNTTPNRVNLTVMELSS